jgi:hypothetical protein
MKDAMTPDKELSVAENFSVKFTRRIKYATLVLQSHWQPKSSGMETVLLTDLKCDTLTGRINR